MDINWWKQVFRVPVRSAVAEGNLERAAVSKGHPMFGAMKGLVRIAPWTDLTDPADPDWGGTETR